MADVPEILERCLGGLELDSVAAGLVTGDAVAKSAEVRLALARPIEPGRFLILFDGEVEAVGAAVARGREVAGASLVDSLFLPNPHPLLRRSLNGGSGVVPDDAVGVLETLTVCTLILAADAAAKTADVRLVEIRLAMGLSGKSFVTLTGEVGDVEAAIERGASLASERGRLVGRAVVPRPDAALARFIGSPVPPFSEMDWTSAAR